MSKKANKTDELVEAILDDRILNALVTRLKPTIHEILTEFRISMEVMIKNQVSEMVQTLSEPLHSQIRDLTGEMKVVNLKLDAIENEQRLNCLIVQGIPVSADVNSANRTDVAQPLLSYFRDKLNLEIDDNDIDIAYKLPRGQHTKPPPILIKFTSRRVRDYVYYSRRPARSDYQHHNTVFINEYLTRHNANLFSHARSLVKDKRIFKTWTRAGYTFIKSTDSREEKPLKITRLSDFPT